MFINLYDYQLDAIQKMKRGCILCGGVGSGKSRTALAYYYSQNGGDLYSDDYVKMKKPCDLYVITTARKRDTHEWESDMIPFLITPDEEIKIYKHKVVIDSWNNIQKYANVMDAFFIFDEQRVVGYGNWAKTFIKISKSNHWILLSATPGDTWSDYIPVFIANGYYRNKTDFYNEHVVLSRMCKFPKIERYLNSAKLEKLRDSILVDMNYGRLTTQHHTDILVDYDVILYKLIIKRRWNIYEEAPIKNASEFCLTLRHVVNADESRKEAVLDICKDHQKVIIFYNYNYELNILRNLPYEEKTIIAEWNGSKHEPIPDSDRWVYLVQYTAGAEGWNCILTDTIIFYSQNYSYKIMTQASGRIDRLNSPFKDLYYYHLKSRASIDLAISRALKSKKEFNARKFSIRFGGDQNGST